MAVTDPHLWHSAPEALAPREGFGVLLHDLDQKPPVLPIEVRAQDVTCAGLSQASREVSRALLVCPQKYLVIHLGLVYFLDDW